MNEKIASSLSTQSQWYVIFTKPNNEKKVFKELQSRDVETLLPIQKVIRQWSDRKKEVEIPLFPNYLFINVMYKDLWSVVNIDGVIRFVSFNKIPATLKESEIEMIKLLTSGSDRVKVESNFSKGQKVKIKSGPFLGLEGLVLNTKNKSRLFIELKSIGKLLSVEIENDMLEMCN